MLRFILLLLITSASCQFKIEPVNNTIGIFYHEETSMKISNDKWTLIVYKETATIKTVLDRNDQVLESIKDLINTDNTPMLKFKSEVQTHISLLTQISDSLKLKYQEVFADTQASYLRSKRGLFNGVGSVLKVLTGNLDASDGEYYNNCINNFTERQHRLEDLMQNQISVTDSLIKTFNKTIQKLQIDEENFNKNLIAIEKSIYNIENKISFYQSQLEIISICETLMESYAFLESTIDDILNSITFARLKIIHTSIITPIDLITSLREISQSLSKNNLPLPIHMSTVAQYLDIIELSAYQTDSRVVFILKIPLVQPETYSIFRLLPIPILDHRTGLYHLLSTSQRYIAKDDDSMLYVSLPNLDHCKTLRTQWKICSDILPYPLDSTSICEAQLFLQLTEVPKTCKSSIIFAQGYNVQELNTNDWLIAVTDPLQINIKCINRVAETNIIKTNSILRLQPECNAIIGSTRVHAKNLVTEYKNVTYKNQMVIIPYECCKQLPAKHNLPELTPLKLSNLDIDDLNVAQYKLNQYSEELDKLINQPIVYKPMSWFKYFATTLIVLMVVLIVLLYLYYKSRRGPNSRKSHTEHHKLTTIEH